MHDPIVLFNQSSIYLKPEILDKITEHKQYICAKLQEYAKDVNWKWRENKED